MTNSKANLLLHPIRMRIIVEISGGRMTVKELAQAMPDVPQATLYRHVKALTEGGILSVVEENPVRGTVEHVYAVRSASLTAEDLAHLSKDELLHAGTMVITGFLGDFRRYLEGEDEAHMDVIADGLDFTKLQLNLSDDELRDFRQELWRVVQSKMQNVPSSGRKRLIFSYLIIPSGDR
jgi:DNA-binding transcriptional ArsR family regulator